MTELIQIGDDPRTPADVVRLVAPGSAPLIPMFSYLMVTDRVVDVVARNFLVQTSAPNRNLNRFSSGPLDTLPIAQIMALLEDRGYDREALVNEIRFYEAKVINRIGDEGDPEPALLRPTIGSTARIADANAIVGALALPQSEERDYRVARLNHQGDAIVPVELSESILDHHMLVAGSTGSGKSELLTNIAHVADAFERTIILFDHKPDHQNHHELAEHLPAGDRRAFSSVDYYTFDENDPNRLARRIKVRAKDLPVELIAATVFHRNDESNMAEAFANIVEGFKAMESNQGRDWQIEEVIDWVRTKKSGEIKKALDDDQIPLLDQTVKAMQRRVYRQASSRIPRFLRSTQSGKARRDTDVMGNPKTSREVATIEDLLSRGLKVIRITEDDARSYGLFLAYLLREASAARELVGQQKGKSDTPKIAILIDEAADIFKAESKHLRASATNELAQRIRKGRSLHIGYVIAVQDASDVPENIRQNLNSSWLGRHRHLKTLKEAMPTAGQEMVSMMDKLGPGQMIANLFGVPSTLNVQADRARSKLTVTK